MPKVSKFFRVAVEGATADGRTIERQQLVEMAASYNRETYAARVNMEHIRGITADPPFRALGDVIALKTEEVTLNIAGKDEKRLANDHWLMIALSYLYQETKDEKYVEHSLNLARAVRYQYEKNRPAWKNYRDFQGGYYDPPRSTPAATRGEGLVAVTDTCRVAGRECEWVWELLEETIRHENLSQYDPDMMWWVKNKKKAFGGWDGGLIDTDIRNDFVQHNMSAVIGTERHMAYRARKEELAGGPIWTRLNLDDGLKHAGVPPEQMQTLREATNRYRGDTRWETKWKEMKAAKEPEGSPEEQATLPK